MYPVMLGIRDQECLVVGGGGVAQRKVEGLVAEGALVTVVAPDPVPPLGDLARAGRIRLMRRAYAPGEAVAFALVFAATDDREVNRRVYEDASEQRIWVNVADDPELCTFHLPARVQRGNLQLAVASDGSAPFAVRRLRRLLEQRFGAEWAEWMEAAARFRGAVRSTDLSRAEQEARYELFFGETIDREGLTARIPSSQEEERWLAATPSAKRPTVSHVAPRLDHSLPSGVGLVSLVGAGPGDPGLLTLRGHRRLMRADAVVYDRLAATALPCHLATKVELHSVGKEPGRHPVPQEEINALLVRLAREGKRVVRLKGGDPFVFGRGGEEAEALVEAGIPFEVVPCVTAGVAVPTYAGIPVTQRREAVRVTMVTAHEAIKTKGPQVRWDLLAADPHATLLGYMGVTSLPDVVDSLLSYGMDPHTPAAMIADGTTSAQRIVRSTVAELPKAVEEVELEPPALFVIGPTIRHAEKLDWFTTRPLFGQRIGMFSPAGEIGDALELVGAEIVEVPLQIAEATRVVLQALPATGWIFRTADEVEALEEHRDAALWAAHSVAWCLNDEATERAGMRGWSQVERLAGASDSDALVALVLGAVGNISAAPDH